MFFVHAFVHAPKLTIASQLGSFGLPETIGVKSNYSFDFL
ncbi:MAG: hypothetical protein AVDCRST_MAG56-7656 [uncultured Cytophagales bacterium]|uniref:Uncharacterized protein n=1 Tax=uncultured Cytophagales bacterium TaxID=158755 RepID=A0A6J4LMC1_9SPHI|nr:MAG: hypothetical protein AVDCRST_MAG56-7656 [uncultured Cytophagales bacterium]